MYALFEYHNIISIFASNNYNMDIGKALKYIRKERNLKAKEVSQITGMNPNTISMMESNKTVPSKSTLATIADLYKTDIARIYLMAIEPEDIPEKNRHLWDDFDKLRTLMFS